MIHSSISSLGWHGFLFISFCNVSLHRFILNSQFCVFILAESPCNTNPSSSFRSGQIKDHPAHPSNRYFSLVLFPKSSCLHYLAVTLSVSSLCSNGRYQLVAFLLKNTSMYLLVSSFKKTAPSFSLSLSNTWYVVIYVSL